MSRSPTICGCALANCPTHCGYMCSCTYVLLHFSCRPFSGSHLHYIISCTNARFNFFFLLQLFAQKCWLLTVLQLTNAPIISMLIFLMSVDKFQMAFEKNISVEMVNLFGKLLRSELQELCSSFKTQGHFHIHMMAESVFLL